MVTFFDSQVDRLAEGQHLGLRGTVKAHKVFKGQKQTQVNRIKVSEVLPL